MATGKDLDLKLRIRADIKQGQTELKQFDAALAQTGQQAQQTNTQLGATSAAVDKTGAAAAAAAAKVNIYVDAAGRWREANGQFVSVAHQAELGLSSLGTAADQAGRPLDDTTDAMRRAGLTAGQYQQAMRMLPMQLTDVVTSLATGMPVWMVAIQQGGQIRDSFGGIGNAASAVLGSINPMTAGLVAAAAAGVTLVAAFEQGRAEASAYEQALILTGNAAGTSADQLATMAARMDETQGTQRQAAAALAEIAASGKIAGDQMELVGSAAIAMERSTGRAVSDTVGEFAKLAEEPSKASAELNKQYGYLTASVYRQIRALEDQGDKVGAARLAVEAYGQATLERSGQIEERLGYLTRAWRSVGDMASEAWDSMLNIGRAATLQQQLQEAQAGLERLQNRRLRNGTLDTRGIQEAEERVERLQQQIDDDADQAAHAQLTTRLNQGAVADQQAVGQYLQGLKRETEQLKDLGETEQALELLRQHRISTESELGRQVLAQAKAKEDQIASNEAAEEAERAAERAQRERTQTAERQHQQQERYVQGLERQASVLGMTATEVRRYELEQQGLTGTLRQAAEAQLATIEAFEQQQRAMENARTNSGLQADYLRAAGQPVEAAMLEIETRFAQLRRQMLKDGNDAGLEWIDKLIPVERARARLDGLQAEIEGAISATDRAESRISTELDAGLIGEMEAREKILALRRQEAAMLERQLPALREIAAQGGVAGEQALARIGEIENQIILARNAASDFERALESGITDGIQTAVQGLAEGTLTLREAVSSLLSSVSDALAQLAAQQVAESVMGLFSGAAQGESLTVGAAAVTGSAAALTGAGATLLAGAAAIESAAAKLAAAGAVAGAAGSAGEGGGIFSSIKSLFGFAAGGQVTGPGTGTSDSIAAWLSDGEFVTREAVVSQPGALDFLHAFNARGMAALDDYARRVRHASGGLAGVPAPSLAAPAMPSLLTLSGNAGGQGTGQQPVNLKIVNSFDAGEAVSVGLASAAGERAFLNVVAANRQKIKAMLG